MKACGSYLRPHKWLILPISDDQLKLLARLLGVGLVQAAAMQSKYSLQVADRVCARCWVTDERAENWLAVLKRLRRISSDLV